MLIPSILLCVWVIVVMVVVPIVMGVIKKVSAKTRSKFDDIIINSLSVPLIFILLAIGLKIWVEVVSISPTYSKYVKIATIVLFALGIISFIDKLFTNWIRIYSKDIDFVKTSGNLLKIIFRIIILVIALLIILDSLGVSITPLIASLGVGSIAVALALQSTLANLFAGISILVDKPVKVGDYIKLESGEEGYVAMVGWRSIRVRQLANNEVTIPNSKLVDSQIINYYAPEKELTVRIQVGVSYESDLEHVERVTIEVARGVLKEVKGGIPEFEPFIRYHTFGNFSIDFTVIMRAQEYVDMFLIRHEFIKRLHRRYKEEGIVIPFPITTLDFNESYAQPIFGEIRKILSNENSGRRSKK